MIDVNLLGVVHGTIAAYPLMVRQGSGHIVNTASLAGLIGYPVHTPYATTKHAVVGLSISLRAEAADLGVRVSVVCPGYVDTGIFDAVPIIGAEREAVLAQIPFKRMDVTQAAQTILKGVVRNRPFVVFPCYGRLLWWLYRIHPALLLPLRRKTVEDFRAVRTEA